MRGTDCVTEQMVILFAAYPISISPAKLKAKEYIVKVSVIDLQYFAVLIFLLVSPAKDKVFVVEA